MSLEEQRLELDRNRFSHEKRIDDLKLELETLRAQSDARFASRHLASIITGIVSLAAVVVSLSQIFVANIHNRGEMQATSAQQDREWKLRVATFVIDKQDSIFSPNAEIRSRVSAVMHVTFPPEITGPLFERLAESVEKLSLPKGYFRLQSRATDLYLSLDKEGSLIQANLDETETPIWTAIPTGEKGYCYLTMRAASTNGKDQCLEIKPGKPDDHIGLGKRKTGSADDQLWAFEEVQPGSYVITSKLTQQAIDVPWGDPNNKLLGFFFAHKNNNQQWKLIHLNL